ncbi:hypothetical protein [Amaricoccus sp.]|uniref:hypothetical protein n=1 Tax=Amaricoccus sp. TaxID=1872485 RepID=UPI00262B6F3C|nr:hypothetical protein [uncultured Amaricoccus sp.]
MIVVKNALAIIEANDDLDQAKVLRKAELNPSFFANFAKSKTGNMTLESVQKLAYGLSVPSVALLLSSDTREMLVRILHNYGTMLPESADLLSKIVSEIQLRPTDRKPEEQDEADKKAVPPS